MNIYKLEVGKRLSFASACTLTLEPPRWVNLPFIIFDLWKNWQCCICGTDSHWLFLRWLYLSSGEIKNAANTTTSTRPRRQKMSTTSPGVTSRESGGQHHRKLAQNVVRNRQGNLTRPYWTVLYRTEQVCALLNRYNRFWRAINNRHHIVRALYFIKSSETTLQTNIT